MATISTMLAVNEASTMASGCPVPVLADALLRSMIELCRQTKAWKADLAAIPLVVSQEAYTPVSPVAHGKVHDVLAAHTIINGRRQELRQAGHYAMGAAYHGANDGEAAFFSTDIDHVVRLAPAPAGSVGDLHIYAALCPTDNATLVDLSVFEEFREALLHGTLYRAYRMPNRSWTSAKDAQSHGKLWTHRLAAAGWRSDTEFSKQALRVEARPFA